jgi:hypothetical protein
MATQTQDGETNDIDWERHSLPQRLGRYLLVLSTSVS